MRVMMCNKRIGTLNSISFYFDVNIKIFRKWNQRLAIKKNIINN